MDNLGGGGGGGGNNIRWKLGQVFFFLNFM